MGDDFFDFIHYMRKERGKLILVSSTLHLLRELFSARSPILGFFAEVPISIISLGDTLRSLKGYGLDKKSLLEMAILLREPLMVEYFDEHVDPRRLIPRSIIHSIKTVPALVGEIFIEEERNISAVYEGILRAIASGKTVSGEISSYLFSRRLIKKDDPSIIQQYLKNLVEFGVIKRLRVYGKNKLVYKHVSPLTRIYYYADEKYNISERKPSEKELERIIDEIMPVIVEDNVREFLAEKHGFEETVFEARDYDVDGCLLGFKTLEVALEVKWGRKVDVEGVKENLGRVKAKRRILFVQDKTQLGDLEDIEVMDVLDLI